MQVHGDPRLINSAILISIGFEWQVLHVKGKENSTKCEDINGSTFVAGVSDLHFGSLESWCSKVVSNDCINVAAKIKVNKSKPVLLVQHDIFQLQITVSKAAFIMKEIDAINQLPVEVMLQINRQFTSSLTSVFVCSQRQREKQYL